MSKINSFLHNRKISHTQLGVYMLVMAYVLSFVLLVLGSDSFYRINSRAAGINQESDEVTQNSSEEELLVNPMYSYVFADYMEYDNSYVGEIQSEIVPGDTNWLLGYELNSQEYMQLMKEMDNFQSLKLTEKQSSKDEKEDIIESFSIPTVEANQDEAFSLSKEEIGMLERIVEAEASGEDLKGKIMVANVVLNRLENEEFPDTVKEVIFQRVNGDYQFSPISDKRYYSVKVTKETKKAVEKAIEGEDYSQGALYFMARKITKSRNAKWFDNNLKWLFQHGGHEFYKNK